jgi:tRNA (guanine37-N1)-methyltransferase
VEIHFITGFPDLLSSPLENSIIRRAQERSLVRFFIHNIRDYATDKHKKIDDYPYGGGAGMILKPEPISKLLNAVRINHELEGIPATFMSAQGEPFTQKKAIELSFREKMILLCGHYKGIDERIRQTFVDEEISIGDYILTGGELPALVVTDAVVRLLPGVLNDIDSADTDSFLTGLLDHPHYTRPSCFNENRVPQVLLSGNHAEIEKWRFEKALQVTKTKRPDLYKRYIKNT